MERLREAGLNPNLIYGSSSSGASGSAEKISPAQPAPYKFDTPTKEIQTVADYGVKKAQSDNLKTQNTVLAQEALLKANTSEGVATDNSLKKIQLGIAPELAKSSLQAAQANVRKIEQGVIGNQLDNEYKSGALKDRLKKLQYDALYAKENLEGKQLDNRLNDIKAKLRQLGIETSDPFYIRIFGSITNSNGFTPKTKG
jgi:transcriptional regulator of met regulon